MIVAFESLWTISISWKHCWTVGFFVNYSGWIFFDSPKDVTLCTSSRASSQCLSPLCGQRATVANIVLEMESTNVNGPLPKKKQKFHRAPLKYHKRSEEFALCKNSYSNQIRVRNVTQVITVLANFMSLYIRDCSCF